ncbi:MAG: molecular chaperone TorD family protein [Desulfobulbaceae bacterium]|jgi:TorA maturation chaperone TorD|nr:molecular chaperone TorD family protein [Desulfobulbaceae bacterium]
MSQESEQLSQVFNFLAQATRYPQAEWFNADFLAVLHSFLAQLEVEADEVDLPLEVTPQFLEDVQVDYTRLFINGHPKVIAPPYGSMYIDGSLNDTTADVTRKFYREHGFDTTTNEFPDHLTTELEFLSLQFKEDEAVAHEFIEKLFLPWFVTFRDIVLAEAKTGYIQVVIELIDFFTKKEIEFDQAVA